MVLKNREKIVILLGVLAVAFWAFDYFYYAPQKKKIMNLKAEIQAAGYKLQESAVFSKGVQSLEADVARMGKELQGFRQEILRGEEFRTFLKQLARDSVRLRMKMISLAPQEEKISRSQGKQAPSSLQYRLVTVHLVLHATYSALRDYLRGMEQLPFLVTVDHLKIERKEGMQPFLLVTMELGVRVLSLEGGDPS
jgi:Tfp pilus assembly protein PilO